MTYDVAVVGAGAMGSAAARALAAAGREVVVLEQYELGHVRGGSHGGTRLFRPAAANPEVARLTEQARGLWRELEDESGETLFEVTGGVDHGLGDADIETFRALHPTGEVLSAAEATERWPGMRFETPALYQAGSGRLYADRTVSALQRVADAEFREHSTVKALRLHGDVVELDVPDGAVRARHLVVTAGAWAPKLLTGLVPLPPFKVTQEQPRFFEPVSEGLDWPAFVHGRKASYGLFEPGSGVKVGLHGTGPVVDPDTRDFAVDPESDAVLVRYVEHWFPGVDTTRSTVISCLYDNTPTDNFVIDRVGPITVAVGFCGQGFKFVPLIGEFVRDLVSGDASSVPSRFRLRSHAGD